jgi:hypothetical protein
MNEGAKLGPGCQIVADGEFLQYLDQELLSFQPLSQV